MTFYDRRTPLLAEERARIHGVPMSLRARIEGTVEYLIGILDRIDGDPDLEPEAFGEPDDEAELNFQPELRGGAHVGA